MNKISKILIIIVSVFVLMLTSCRQTAELAYISDAQRDSAQAILTNYATTIHPGDMLYIYINSLNPETVIAFNQKTHTLAAEVSRVNLLANSSQLQTRSQLFAENNMGSTSNQLYGYKVDEAGIITFPVLGKMHVAGITHDSLQLMLQRRLIEGDYVKDPVVTVSSLDFRVSVIGEVANPQELHITGDRLTLLEAIAMCGDLTIFGLRENITVLREIDGNSTPVEVDITSKTLFDSPVYYLQPNDIVYVQPNDKRKREYGRNDYWRSYVSLGADLAGAVYKALRYYVIDKRGVFD